MFGGVFQIRHFLPPHIHELFQRKLRDRALQEMPNFRWCSHVSLSNIWMLETAQVRARAAPDGRVCAWVCFSAPSACSMKLSG